MYSSDRMMRNMLQSMGMGMPLGDPFTPPTTRGGQSQQHQDHFSAMMPFGMGFGGPMSLMGMMGGDPFQGIQQAMMMGGVAGSGSVSYCSSSVSSYTTDEHGRPQVYQQSSEIKQGPDGLKETKRSVRDSRTGHQELTIGHHLNDKAHIKKKSKSVYTGEEEQAEDFVNLEEEEAEAFEQNWRQKANSTMQHHTSSYPYASQLQCGSRTRHNNNNRLALTSSAQEDHQSSNHHHSQPSLPSPKRLFKSVLKKKKKTKGDSREAKV